MKKLYYLVPFAAFPMMFLFSALIGELLSHAGPGVMTGIFFAIMILLSAAIAMLTVGRSTFDLVITVANTLAIFLTTFMLNFCDRGETYSRFDLSHGLTASTRAENLVLYVLVAVAAFVFSYKKLRIKTEIK